MFTMYGYYKTLKSSCQEVRGAFFKKKNFLKYFRVEQGPAKANMYRAVSVLAAKHEKKYY